MEFQDRMKQVFERGLSGSREALSEAGKRMGELGEKGMLRFEISHLESQAEKLFAKLGAKMYERRRDSGSEARVELDEAEVQDLLREIDELEERIRVKEASLRMKG